MFRKLFYLFALPALAFLVVGILDYRGIFWHTELFTKKYEVRGIDISHHQGLIDWNGVLESDVDFAYIKATEATGHIDSYFFYNWRQSKAMAIYRGAYHFFSMEVSGREQAEYFISVVPLDEDALPPVIDLEVSLNSDRDEVLREVGVMSGLLEEHYGKKPIIYMDLNVYEAFIEDGSLDNPIWIREIYFPPTLEHSLEWTFWQYSDRGSIKGIRGPVDQDVYRGTLAEFLEEYHL